jgi:hypothetical protein
MRIESLNDIGHILSIALIVIRTSSAVPERHGKFSVNAFYPDPIPEPFGIGFKQIDDHHIQRKILPQSGKMKFCFAHKKPP